ncbi:MAG: enoyl-CoA hydratase-related protein [Syntrophales bacterium]|nr:enoyl-CoA hydratase-related protein [Syntrophales bacterium]
MEHEDIILYDKQNGIALISFNRPKALNALNTNTNLALVEALDRAEKDDEIKVVIITGAGEKSFVAGADIKEMQNLGAIGAREFALNAKRSVDRIYHLKKPVIAAVNGFCFGGGLEYALACDFRVAAENAKFSLPEITLGIISGSAGTQRLPRLIGMGKAKELIYTGAIINAQEALSLGLINYVFPREALIKETMALAGKIASRSSVALSLAKSAINRGADADMDTASMFEIDCFALCFATEEQKKAMAEFTSKK